MCSKICLKITMVGLGSKITMAGLGSKITMAGLGHHTPSPSHSKAGQH